MPRRALGEWQVEHLRVACFSPSPVDVWDRISPGVPAQTESRDTRIGKYERTIQRDSALLSLVQLPGRVDVVLGSSPTAPRDPAGIGSVVAQAEQIGALGVRLLEEFVAGNHPVQRLAFAGVLNLSVDSHRQGYTQLQDYLPAVALDPESSDFMYRINRPQSVAVGGGQVRINRLSQWSVAKVLDAMFQVGPAGLVRMPGGTEQYSCHLVLDVNTDPERAIPLPAAGVLDIWKNLIDMGLALAEHGDRA